MFADCSDDLKLYDFDGDRDSERRISRMASYVLVWVGECSCIMPLPSRCGEYEDVNILGSLSCSFFRSPKYQPLLSKKGEFLLPCDPGSVCQSSRAQARDSRNVGVPMWL